MITRNTQVKKWIVINPNNKPIKITQTPESLIDIEVANPDDVMSIDEAQDAYQFVMNKCWEWKKV